MSKRLHLLRHAKSEWAELGEADRERSISARGEQEASRLRDHLRRAGLEVALVLCSPARRTVETWSIVGEGVGGDPPVRLEPDIYEAGVPDLLDLLGSVPDDVPSVLLVGHNPALSEIVWRFDPTVLPTGMPPAGFVTMDVREAWRDLRPGTVTVTEVVHPAKLRS